MGMLMVKRSGRLCPLQVSHLAVLCNSFIGIKWVGSKSLICFR